MPAACSAPSRALTPCITPTGVSALEFERWQRELDRLSAENGSTWREDIMMVRHLWWVYALSEDVVGLRRAVRQLDAFAAEAPALQGLRDAAHASYLIERGRSEEALDRFGETLTRFGASANAHSTRFIGVHARLLRTAGRAGDALALCERALGELRADDAEFAVSNIGLEFEYALALAELGQAERARAACDRLVRREAAHDNPLIRGRERRIFTLRAKRIARCSLGNGCGPVRVVCGTRQ